MGYRILCALAFVSLLSCSDPDSNKVSCNAYPLCQSGTVEVVSCDAREACAPVSLCGDTIFCADRVEITASDYDSDCQSDDDCRLIFEGEPCECHECETGAIADIVYPDYEADWAPAMCEPFNCTNNVCNEPRVAKCEENRCVARTQAELDIVCEEATDESTCIAAGCGSWTSVWNITGSDGTSEGSCQGVVEDRCFAEENAAVNGGICSVWWRDTLDGVEVVHIGAQNLNVSGWQRCEGAADEPIECSCSTQLGCLVE